jgi:hypothetical protein
MALSKKQREVLRMMFGGRCAYCGCELPEKWHADHIEAVIRETEMVKDKDHRYVLKQTGKLLQPHNDHIDNMYPACPPCNIDKGCGTVEDFRKGIAFRLGVLRRNHSAFRFAEKFGLVTVNEISVVFHFEKVAQGKLPAAHPANDLPPA